MSESEHHVTTLEIPRSAGVFTDNIKVQYFHHNGEKPITLKGQLAANICRHAMDNQDGRRINKNHQDLIASSLDQLGIPEPLSVRIASAVPNQAHVSVFGAYLRGESVSMVVANDDYGCHILFSRNITS